MLRMVEDAYWYQNMKACLIRGKFFTQIDTILYLRYCIIALLLVHTGIWRDALFSSQSS